MAIESYDDEVEEILRKRVENFDSTSEDVLREISNFNWLWPVFETFALRTLGVEQLSVDDFSMLASKEFADEVASRPRHSVAIEFFRIRYQTSENANHQLNDLCKSENGKVRALIASGLSIHATEPAPSIALMLIFYRLRNNLFHGTKGGIGFKDQLNNFKHANDLLKAWLQIHIGEEDI